MAYQQVTKCIDIGLLCQEIDPTKRPPIRKVICDINEMDSTDGQTRNAYESFSVISPYPEDDMLGTEPLELHLAFELNKKISNSLKLTNPTDAYIAFNIQNMSHLPYCMQPTKGIVPPRSKCSVDVTLDPQGNAPWDMQRANEFIVWSTKVNDGLIAGDITANMFSPESGVVDGMNLDVVFYEEESTKESKELIVHMSNIKTDGTVGDVKKSQECLVPTPLRTSSTGSQNPQGAAKGSSETQQASDKTSECTDKLLVLNTIASKDLTPQSVSGEMFINKTDGKVADETIFDESLSPVMTLWESSASYKNYQEGESTSNQNYQEGAQAFSEPQSAPDTTTESEVRSLTRNIFWKAMSIFLLSNRHMELVCTK